MVCLHGAYFGDFFKNNYKTQTMSLVRKRFKLIQFLIIRVQRTRFLDCYYNILPTVEAAKFSTQARNRVHWTQFLSLETECIGLDFYTYKSSPLNSVLMYKKRVQRTRFPSLVTHIAASVITAISPHSKSSHVGVTQIESKGLVFHEWSPSLHVLPWVLAGTCFFLFTEGSHSFSSILFRNSALMKQLS